MFDNFVFYGSWRETLEGMAEDFGEDYAKEALWNIMTAATAGDITTEKKFIVSFISGAVMPNINKAKDRYAAAVENGKKGGRTPIKLDEQEVMEKKKELKTWKAVADYFKVTEQCLRNKRKEWEKQKNQKNLDIDKDIDIDIDIEKEKDIDNDNDIDIDNDTFGSLQNGETIPDDEEDVSGLRVIHSPYELYTKQELNIMACEEDCKIFGQM